MPPLRSLLLKVLRIGSFGVAVSAAAVIGIELWKHGGDLSGLNPGFLIMVALLLVAGLWLARSIGRELREHGP
jgi:hypothetical protein